MLLNNLRVNSFLWVLFLMYCCSTIAQTPGIDSLKSILESHTAKDTARVNLLNEIAYAAYYRDPDAAKIYAAESFQLATELGYAKGKAESLWLQGITCIQQDPGKAMGLFEKALEIASQNSNINGVAKYTNAVGTVYGMTGQDSMAVECYIKAISIARQVRATGELGKYLTNLSQAYNRMGRTEQALEGYNKALEVLIAKNDSSKIAICYNSMGNIYTSQGNYPFALECFHKGLKIREEMRDFKAISISLVSIGSIYFAQKDYAKALEYNHKVVDIASKSGHKHTLAGGFLNIGLIYLQTKDQKALEYFNKALVISEDLKIIPLKISILQNMGQFYLNENNPDKALENLFQALDLSERTDKKSTISSSKLQIAKVYHSKNDYSRTLEYAVPALELAKKLKMIEIEKDLHQLLSDVYAKTRQYKSAYIHGQQFKNLSDSIYNENNIRQIAELEFTYKFDQEKQAIALEQNKKDAIEASRRKLQYVIIIFLAVCFGISSLLAVYIHRLYRFRNRANQAIRDLELEKKRLLEKEIERINLELEQNRKSLTATSLKLIQNSERDAGNVRRLEAVLDGTSPEGRKILLSIISDIKRMSRSSNWNEFELLFQKVHNSFYDKLNEKFPDLTANERKLCAFLKLNMSSKDIANITFQSDEALKKARQRLRQKLGIDRDTNLVVFLQNI